LTPDLRLRTRRNLAAARKKYEAGALVDALALLSAAQGGSVDDASRAEIQHLQAQLAFASSRGSDAPPLFLAAARQLETVNPALARATYLEALSATIFAAHLGHGTDVVEISEAALAGPPLPEVPGPSDLLLQGLALRFTKGLAVGIPVLKEAVRAFERETDLLPDEARWLFLASQMALFLWDDDA